MHRIFLLCSLIFLLQGCGSHENKGDAGASSSAVMLGDTVVLPSKSPIAAKLALQTAASTSFCSKFTTTGTVKLMAGSSAEISTPFEGRVARSFVRLGQKVRAGMPMFEVYSSDYFETVKGFMQAKQEKQLASSRFNRQNDLVSYGVGSKKDLEEADAAYQIAKREYERAEASLRIYNIKPADAAMGKPLVVCSPISGEVVKCDLTVGQYLKDDALPLVSVANLDKVWVVARVKEKSIGLISQHDNVEVTCDAYPGKPVHGTVSYIGNLLDEQTRSVEFYIDCLNPDRMLKPGMFATVGFNHKIDNAIVVPASAILQDENRTYVFLKVGEGKFVKRTVVTATCNDTDVIVRNGLAAGDVVVCKGGVLLR